LLREIENAKSHPSEVDQLLVDFYRPKVPGYASELLEYEPCKPWAQKIQHAFEAHMEEKYDLAVPMWLIIIDGVARAIAKDSGFRLYKSVGNLGSYKKQITRYWTTSARRRRIGLASLLSRPRRIAALTTLGNNTVSAYARAVVVACIAQVTYSLNSRIT
jgi:hypothetical protein